MSEYYVYIYKFLFLLQSKSSMTHWYPDWHNKLFLRDLRHVTSGSEFGVNSFNGSQTITDLQQMWDYCKNTNISVKFSEQFNNIYVNVRPSCSKNQFYNTKSVCNNF
jgi:hypothetical protein